MTIELVQSKPRWDFHSFRIKNCLEIILIYNFGNGTKPILPRNQNGVWGVIANKHSSRVMGNQMSE